MTNTPEANEAPLGHRLRGAILAIASDPDAPVPREAFTLALNVGEEAARELDALDAAASDGTIVSVLSEAILAVDTSLDPIVAPDPKVLRLVEAATAAEAMLKAYAVGGPPRPKRQIEIDNDRHANDVRRLKAQARAFEERGETIRQLKAERDGVRAALREHEAEARKLADENAKLKASNGRLEARATLATNKADRRAEENAQLSRAMIELGQIIGEERQRARDAWEAVAQERERADHQEARKEEQIAKLGGTIFERIESDERVKAWEQVAKHRAFVPCYSDGERLLPAMLRRLDQLLSEQGGK